MTKLIPIICFAIIMAWLSENTSRHRLNEEGKLVYAYKDKVFYFILAASMAVFVGLRTRGNDTYTYRLMYENIGTGWDFIVNIDWSNISAAPGLQCYCMILKTLGATTQDYFMLTALITVGIYLWFIRKYTCNIFLSIFYFITMGAYTFTMAAIKQTMAVAFLLLATDNAIQGKWAKYPFWVAFAELFHPYAFIYLVVPFVTFAPWSKGTRFLLAGSVFVALFMSRLLGAIDSVTEALGYNYAVNEFTGAGVNIFRVLVVWVPLVLSFLQREKLRRSEDRTMNIIVNLMMVNAVIMFIGLFGTANYFARLANYFLIFQTIALPWLLRLFAGGNRKVITGVSMVGFAAYYYYGEALTNGGFDLNYDFITFWEYLRR
ncbi:MAG: EpsG family protein [Agathobacter sp.]